MQAALADRKSLELSFELSIKSCNSEYTEVYAFDVHITKHRLKIVKRKRYKIFKIELHQNIVSRQWVSEDFQKVFEM